MLHIQATVHVPSVRVTPRGRPVIGMHPHAMPIAIARVDPASLGEPVLGVGDHLGRIGDGGLWKPLTRGVDSYPSISPGWRERPEYAHLPDDPDAEDEFPEDPAATVDDLRAMVSGGTDWRWLEATRLACGPFWYDRIYKTLRYADQVPHGLLPSEETVKDVEARVARHVTDSLRFDGGRVWVRIGVTGRGLERFDIDAHGQDVFAPRRIGAFRAGIGRMPIPVERVDATLRFLARTNRPHVPAEIRAQAARYREHNPGGAGCDDEVRLHLNVTAFTVFDIWNRSGSHNPSVEAPALAGRLREAMTGLAPWAALGAMNLIERHEWATVAGHVIEAAHLVRRSYPWGWAVEALNEAVAWCEEVLLPHVGAGAPDDIDLGPAVPDRLHASPAPAEGRVSVRDILGAGVFAAEGGRLGTVRDVVFDAAGRISDIRVEHKGKRLDAPFAGFEVVAPRGGGDRWRLRIPKALAEGWSGMQPVPR